MENSEIKEQLNRIEAGTLAHKKVLTFEEAANFMGVSKSHLYHLTSRKAISFFKPNGKKLYFLRINIETFLLQNPVKTNAEIEANVETTKKGGRI